MFLLWLFVIITVIFIISQKMMIILLCSAGNLWLWHSASGYGEFLPKLKVRWNYVLRSIWD